MIVECCDVCKHPLGEVYEDEHGKRWSDISFREKIYRTWTEYISVCGRCRAEIAKRKKEV